MNLIIIEGTDNIGKDTVISKLCEQFDTVTLIHCSGPQSKIFQSQEQDMKFKQYAENISYNIYDVTDCIIMNRSHIGEYVYGQLYRNRSANDVKKMIDEVDDILLNINNLNIKYVHLLSSSI